MTWTSPVNLKDNAIINASYWNDLLGEDSSLVYLQRKTNQKTACTVFTATFQKVIEYQSSGAASATIIDSFSVNKSIPSYPDSSVFIRRNGRIKFRGNTPFIAIWNMSIPTSSSSPITLRSTFNVARRRADRRQVQTLASYYFYRSSSVQNKFGGVYAGISRFNNDRYYLTCNHNDVGSDITVSGTITIILNPSFV